MTPDTYSYLLALIEYDEDNLVDAFNEGEKLNSLLQKRAEVKKQLAEIYTFYILQK
jgi:hypothetical protein